MKIKVSEATQRQLDWLASEAEGLRPFVRPKGIEVLFAGLPRRVPFSPSTDWAQGGVLIEREEIEIHPVFSDGKLFCWQANGHDLKYDEVGEYIDGSDHMQDGPTPLIAAMRTFVSSRLGDEVEIPEELT